MTHKPEHATATTGTTTHQNEATPAPRIPDRPTLKRNKKRVVKREQLQPAKLANTRKPPPPKPKKKPKPATPKAPTISPSDIRLDNLNASLNTFDTWRNWQPLALGIEKAIFQHIAKHSLSCSKRVVKKLLHQHTRNTRYLQAIKSCESRYNLDGTEAGTITQIEQEHSARMLQK